MKAGIYWAIAVVAAFVSVISFFNINSYWADTHGTNWLMWIGGFAGAIGTYWGLRNVAKRSN